MEEILKEIGIQVLYQTSTDLVAYCCFHTNRDTPAFNISKAPPYPWNCHNGKCGKAGRSLFSLFEYKGYSEQEIHQYFKYGFDTNRNDLAIERILKDLYREEETNEWEGIDPAKFRIDDEDCGFPAKQYLSGRNIGQEAYEFFGMGYSARKQMLIVPVFDQADSFVGLIGRGIKEKRYQYSNGLQRKRLVWNLNNARHCRNTNDIILTEGALDAVYIWQAGYKNVGAVFGSSISEDQLAIIRRYFSGITCFFDNDAAGVSLSNSIVEKVHDLNVSVVRYEGESKDPGDLTVQEIERMIWGRVTGVEIMLGL